MQIEDNVKIINRFFKILEHLRTLKVLRGKGGFANKYGVEQTHLRRLEREPHRGGFQVAWLMYLVRDYNVSPEWILTGKGKRYTIPPIAQPKYIYKKKENATPNK